MKNPNYRMENGRGVIQEMLYLEEKLKYQFEVKEDPYNLQMTLVRLEKIYKLIMETTGR